MRDRGSEGMAEPTAVSVTGVGYVGLPLALAFARHWHVIAYDSDEERIEALRRCEDPNGEMTTDDFADCDIVFTTDPGEISKADFHIVAVPTPVDASHAPDTSLLTSAVRTVGSHIKEGDTVVIESSVYPGCTEEECLPILENASGLRVDIGFGLGYSPERINPGDKSHRLETVVKVVSAHDERTLNRMAEAYGRVVDAGVFKAASIRVAEAAKIVENTQRDVNIALMNELSIVFGRLGIETDDVIAAASTKWNFLPFRPGLVGGHCVSVDPYYLEYKARETGYGSQVIDSARRVNDFMGRHVAWQTVERLKAAGVEPGRARVLLMGLTYKADVADVRDTRSMDIVGELRAMGVGQVDIVDPVASRRDAQRLYGVEPLAEPRGEYDAIVVAVGHSAFRRLGQEFFDRHLAKGGVLMDVGGIYRNRLKGIASWQM